MNSINFSQDYSFNPQTYYEPDDDNNFIRDGRSNEVLNSKTNTSLSPIDTFEHKDSLANNISEDYSALARVKRSVGNNTSGFGSQSQIELTRAINNGIVASGSGEFLDAIVQTGRLSPLTLADRTTLLHRVEQNMDFSQRRLADYYTRNSIYETVASAVDNSPTFRAVISFNRGFGEQYARAHDGNYPNNSLENLRYRNLYTSNRASDRWGPEVAASIRSAYESGSFGSMPISPERGVDFEGFDNTSRVNIGVTPNHGISNAETNLDYQIWQRELLHSVLSLVTRTSEAAANSSRVTEVEDRVYRELGLEMSYDGDWTAPQGVDQIRHSNAEALVNYLDRAIGGDTNGIDKLAGINRQVFGVSEPDNISFPKGTPPPPPTPRPDGEGVVCDIKSKPIMIRGAMASRQGAPEGITSHIAAYNSSWETIKDLFAYGKPIDGDDNFHRYTFDNKGRIDIEACIIEPTSSDGRKAAIGIPATLGAIAVGVAALVSGPGAAGAAGATFGAITATIDGTYDYDRAYQGYKGICYDENGKQYGKPLYFYAWDSDMANVTVINSQYKVDPTLKGLKNYADITQIHKNKNVSWHTWVVGDAPKRTA